MACQHKCNDRALTPAENGTCSERMAFDQVETENPLLENTDSHGVSLTIRMTLQNAPLIARVSGRIVNRGLYMLSRGLEPRAHTPYS